MQRFNNRFAKDYASNVLSVQLKQGINQLCVICIRLPTCSCASIKTNNMSLNFIWGLQKQKSIFLPCSQSQHMIIIIVVLSLPAIAEKRTFHLLFNCVASLCKCDPCYCQKYPRSIFPNILKTLSRLF